MLRFLKRLAFFLALCAVILVVALLLVDPKHYTVHLEKLLAAKVKENNINLTFTDGRIRVFSTSYDATKVEIGYQNLFITHQFDNLNIDIKALSLLGLKFVLNATGQTYGGELELNLKSPLFGGDSEMDFRLQSLDMSLHPQLRFLGVLGGKLSLDLKDVRVNDKGQSSGNMGLQIRDLQKPGSFRLPLPGSARFDSIGIPAVNNLNGDLEAAWDSDSFELLVARADSSILSVSGNGTLSLDERGRVSDGQLDFDFLVSEEGSRQIGEHLVTLSNGRLAATDREFRLTLRAAGGRPQVEVIPNRPL